MKFRYVVTVPPDDALELSPTIANLALAGAVSSPDPVMPHPAPAPTYAVALVDTICLLRSYHATKTELADVAVLYTAYLTR